MTIKGIVYRIVDIGMRMLQPHELYRAQGFPEWYIIDRDYRGVKYAKDKQVDAAAMPFRPRSLRRWLGPICRKCVLTNRSEPRDEIDTQAAGGSEPPDRLPA